MRPTGHSTIPAAPTPIVATWCSARNRSISRSSTAVTAGQGAAPDVFEHLLAAAREFFLAARAVIDVRGDHVSGVEKSPNGSKDFERIEIS